MVCQLEIGLFMILGNKTSVLQNCSSIQMKTVPGCTQCTVTDYKQMIRASHTFTIILQNYVYLKNLRLSYIIFERVYEIRYLRIRRIRICILSKYQFSKS